MPKKEPFDLQKIVDENFEVYYFHPKWFVAVVAGVALLVILIALYVLIFS